MLLRCAGGTDQHVEPVQVPVDIARHRAKPETGEKFRCGGDKRQGIWIPAAVKRETRLLGRHVAALAEETMHAALLRLEPIAKPTAQKRCR